jgi:uncharacterized protein YlxW (UPF0749 family)
MKLQDQLIIGLICVVLGIFMSLQFKSVQANYLDGLMPNQRSAQLVNELNRLRAEKANLVIEVDALEAELNKITASASEESILVKSLQDQLNRFKSLSGYTDLQGQGIVFTIDNPPQNFAGIYESNIVDEFQHLLVVINELNAAGAEAIAINDQRILSMSEIRSAGGYLSINTQQYQPPFAIKAIGNKDVLEAALSQRFGIVTILRERGYQVDVKRYDTVIVPKFNAIINWQYAGPKE